MNSIKYDYVQGNTDSNGCFSTNLSKDTISILSAWHVGENMIVTPFVNSSYKWAFRLTNTSGSPIAGSSGRYASYAYIEH